MNAVTAMNAMQTILLEIYSVQGDETFQNKKEKLKECKKKLKEAQKSHATATKLLLDKANESLVESVTVKALKNQKGKVLLVEVKKLLSRQLFLDSTQHITHFTNRAIIEKLEPKTVVLFQKILGYENDNRQADEGRERALSTETNNEPKKNFLSTMRKSKISNENINPPNQTVEQPIHKRYNNQYEYLKGIEKILTLYTDALGRFCEQIRAIDTSNNLGSLDGDLIEQIIFLINRNINDDYWTTINSDKAKRYQFLLSKICEWADGQKNIF